MGMIITMGMIIMVTRMSTSTRTTTRMTTPMGQAAVAAITTITITMGMITAMAGTGAAIRTSMADPAELQRLAWFSPAFPIGGFAYSHGIEAAVAAGDIADAKTLAGWIEDILTAGSGRADAILLAEAWRRTTAREAAGKADCRAGLAELAEFGMALGLSSERRLETGQQGASFHALVSAAWPHPDLPALAEFGPAGLPFPVAVGLAGALHGQPLEPLVAAYLQAFAGNLLAAALRLSVIGQSQAQVRLARLLPVVNAVAAAAIRANLADLGTMAFRADLMSLRHEALGARLFRS